MLTTERPTTLDARSFEQLVFDIFEREKDLYSPLEIRGAKRSPANRNNLDGTVRIAWQGREVEFQIAIKARTAPKTVQEALWKLKTLPLTLRNTFLLVVPYITPRIQEMTELEGVSCLDVNGNYIIRSPKFLAIRLDRKNQHPESAPIKKVFSGNSSQVGRLLLCKNRIFSSVNEVFEAIKSAGTSLSLSTISKVLSSLEEELIIEKSTEKSANRIALIQPEKLLDRLQSGYVPPKPLVTLKLKIPGSSEQVIEKLATELSGTIWMFSGESSASQYTMTTAPSILRAYAFQAGDLSGYRQYEDNRFFNVILESTTEPYIYFDRQTSPKNKRSWASRLQTYLELARLDKRERELAESIREDILKEFTKKATKEFK